MRSLVLIVALISAASAARAEDSRESRYGPRPDRRTTALNAASGYGGPVLGWAGKQAPATTPPVQAVQPSVEPWRQMSVRQPMVPAAQSQALPPQQPLPPMSEPWRNLGVRPPPSAPAPQPVAAPRNALPQTIYDIEPAAIAPQAPATPQVQVQAPTMARTYSVGRQYGLQPDALPPLQPNGMVLIAPSEDAPRFKDDEPRHGSPEWLAAGARGDEGADRDNAKDGDL
jgi:hypothetical protein